MYSLEKLIAKFGGTDKVLHFLVGAWICAQFDAYGWGWALLGMFIAVGLDFVKEKWLDDTFDMTDLAATFAGCVVELFICGIREALFGATGILPIQPF